MPGYSEDELQQARQPLRDQFERDRAACVLGHLEVEEREQPSTTRAADIHAITAAVQGFDSRSKVTAVASAPPAPAAAATPPAPIASPAQAAPPPPAPNPPPAPLRPAAGLPPQLIDARAGGIDLLSLGAPSRTAQPRIDLLGATDSAHRASRPVDLAADMRRRHGITA